MINIALVRSLQNQLIMVTIEHWYKVKGRGSDGIISLTFGDVERSDQGQLLKNSVSVRESAIVTIEH